MGARWATCSHAQPAARRFRLPPSASSPRSTAPSWLTGLLTGALALGLSLLVARGLTAPLARLAEAARRGATGHRGERVGRGAGGGTNGCRRQMMADIAHELPHVFERF